MAFLTIEPAPDLPPDLLRQAVDNGPPEVAVEAPHEQMLASAGFTEIEAVDVTAEFSSTQQAWIDTWQVHEPELVEALGRDLVNERQAERRAMRGAIHAGLLRCTLYVCRRADGP